MFSFLFFPLPEDYEALWVTMFYRTNPILEERINGVCTSATVASG